MVHITIRPVLEATIARYDSLNIFGSSKEAVFETSSYNPPQLNSPKKFNLYEALATKNQEPSYTTPIYNYQDPSGSFQASVTRFMHIEPLE